MGRGRGKRKEEEVNEVVRTNSKPTEEGTSEKGRCD
jgi:hypothetical protein